MQLFYIIYIVVVSRKEISSSNSRYNMKPSQPSPSPPDKLYGVINRIETSRPEDAFIAAGDFNKANLRKALPRYHQHISFPTQGGNTLDHVYSPFRNVYKALL